MTIWNTKQWKERREEILLIKSACEWCGSRTRLQIAHKDKWKKTGFERYSEMKDDDDYEKKFQKAIASFAKCCLPIAYDFTDESIENITMIELSN